MRTVLTILVAGLLVFGATGYATAQDGARFGMGVELMNQPTMVGLSYYVDEFDELVMTLDYEAGNTSLTPVVLFTIQATPAVFVEPYLGFHKMSSSAEYPGGKVEMNGHVFTVGAGLIYALKPDATVSPILHPMFDFSMVKADLDVTGAGTAEITTTAFSLGLGVGGLVNIKDGLYMTAEARGMWVKVGDFDTKVSPGDFTDDVTESQWQLDTDMAIGIRFVF